MAEDETKQPSESQSSKTRKSTSVESASDRWLGPITAIFAFGIFAFALVKGYWDAARPETRAWLLKHWYLFLIVFLLLIALTVFSPLRRRLRTAQETTRVGITIFILLPAVFLIVNGVIFVQPQYQVAALRSVFLLAVCLFPVSLYYLFIATRKYGLLNEFVLNLDRLGLLDSRPRSKTSASLQESDSERQLRISAYLQRFQAVYGRLAIEQKEIDAMLAANSFSDAFSRSMLSRNISQSLASIFTTGATVPVLLATVLIALGWLLTLPPWQASMASGTVKDWATALKPEQQPIYFAFLGAYFFSIQTLFRRYVRRDLRGTAYVSVCLRIILAAIGAWVALLLIPQRFSSSTETALVLGFVVGVFPPVIWQLLRQFIKKVFRIDPLATTIETQLPITELDGLNLWHRARLEEEDIENVHSMATADLVDLMLNTRFPADRIVDWVDQAVLYTALGPEDKGRPPGSKDAVNSTRVQLRKYGIRTASSLVYAHQHNPKLLEETLTDYAEGSIAILIDSVFTNPNLELIQKWRGLPTNVIEKVQVAVVGA